jgi:polysaccharide pyruvyl transferase WcaK-like protein
MAGSGNRDADTGALATEKRRIRYVGWLGYGNLGDEALYRAIQGIFSGCQLVPAEMASSINSVASPITLIGGSTGLPDWIEWMRPTTYNYVFGAGVKDPAFYGKFNTVVIDKLRNFSFRLVGVRGNASKALLENWGIRSEVIGDPCLSLQPGPPHEEDEKRIAINVGSDRVLWGNSDERVLLEIGRVCRILKRKGFRPVLIPFWRDNLEQINRISVAEGVDVFDQWHNITSALEFIATCKILIGEKLHSLVFSAAAHRPFICLEYQPKCYDFSESVGFSDYCIRTDKVTADKIIAMFHAILGNYEKIQKELVRKVDAYREKQREFASRIVADIGSLPDNEWLPPSSLKRLRNGVFWRTDSFLHDSNRRMWQVWNKLLFLHIMRYMT